MLVHSGRIKKLFLISSLLGVIFSCNAKLNVADAVLIGLGCCVGAALGNIMATNTPKKVSRSLLTLGLPILVLGGGYFNTYAKPGLAVLAGACAAGLYSYATQPQSKVRPLPDNAKIKEFDAKRDLEAINKLFEADWELLTDARRNSGFSIKTMYANRSKPHRGVRRGDLKIKVLYEGNTLAGFISYYIDPQYADLGWIHILCVGKEHRQKGYATRLLHHVRSYFWSRGIEQINWYVAKNNQIACQCYRRFGANIVRCELNSSHGCISFKSSLESAASRLFGLYDLVL